MLAACAHRRLKGRQGAGTSRVTPSSGGCRRATARRLEAVSLGLKPWVGGLWRIRGGPPAGAALSALRRHVCRCFRSTRCAGGSPRRDTPYLIVASRRHPPRHPRQPGRRIHQRGTGRGDRRPHRGQRILRHYRGRRGRRIGRPQPATVAELDQVPIPARIRRTPVPRLNHHVSRRCSGCRTPARG